jgi:hypothetical protein
MRCSGTAATKRSSPTAEMPARAKSTSRRRVSGTRRASCSRDDGVGGRRAEDGARRSISRAKVCAGRAPSEGAATGRRSWRRQTRQQSLRWNISACDRPARWCTSSSDVQSSQAGAKLTRPTGSGTCHQRRSARLGRIPLSPIFFARLLVKAVVPGAMSLSSGKPPSGTVRSGSRKSFRLTAVGPRASAKLIEPPGEAVENELDRGPESSAWTATGAREETCLPLTLLPGKGAGGAIALCRVAAGSGACSGLPSCGETNCIMVGINTSASAMFVASPELRCRRLRESQSPRGPATWKTVWNSEAGPSS